MYDITSYFLIKRWDPGRVGCVGSRRVLLQNIRNIGPAHEYLAHWPIQTPNNVPAPLSPVISTIL